MILTRTFSVEAAETWYTYSPVEIDHHFIGKSCLSITEILVTDQALSGVRNRIQNLARDFKDFQTGRELPTKEPDADDAPGSEMLMSSGAEAARHGPRLTVSEPQANQTTPSSHGRC